MAYIPPHLRNKNTDEKRMKFNDNQTWNRKDFTNVIFYRNDDVRNDGDVGYLENEIASLKNENASLKNEIASLKNEIASLKEQINMLNKDIELYKGNREECVPKSSFDAVIDELKKFKFKSYEYSRKLKDIDDVHRNDTNSLRTEINVLKEELKKSEKQISYLSSNIENLSKENNHLQEVIELMKKPETPAQEFIEAKEENKELIQEDWNNIKASLRYLLSDAKLKKQFSRETGINLAGMKLTLDIIEKI